MKINLIKNEYNQLCPAFIDDFEKIKKLKQDMVYNVDIKKTRNYDFHKKFFALIRKGFENTKTKITNEEFYRHYITMKAGYYESVDTGTGIMILPVSISFEKMGEDEFQQLYDSAFDQIIIDIEADEVLFRNELQSFL